jgi:hypothetical protein
MLEIPELAISPPLRFLHFTQYNFGRASSGRTSMFLQTTPIVSIPEKK